MIQLYTAGIWNEQHKMISLLMCRLQNCQSEFSDNVYVIDIVLILQNMMAASQGRVKTVHVAVTSQERITVPARNRITEPTAPVSCTAICICI